MAKQDTNSRLFKVVVKCDQVTGSNYNHIDLYVIALDEHIAATKALTEVKVEWDYSQYDYVESVTLLAENRLLPAGMGSLRMSLLKL
jgi:hypothetical protein